MSKTICSFSQMSKENCSLTQMWKEIDQLSKTNKWATLKVWNFVKEFYSLTLEYENVAKFWKKKRFGWKWNVLFHCDTPHK